MEIYGAAVADKLDNSRGMLNRRYYRQVFTEFLYLIMNLCEFSSMFCLFLFFFKHCTLEIGSYTKDLSAICNDLSKIFILDNSPGAYKGYPGITNIFGKAIRQLINLREMCFGIQFSDSYFNPNKNSFIP